MFPGVTVVGVPRANGTGGKCGAEEQTPHSLNVQVGMTLRLGYKNGCGSKQLSGKILPDRF